MKAIGYARVSTGDQGLSLEGQAERIRQYCQLRGFDLADVIEDAAVSGGVPFRARPGGGELARRIDKGEADAVVIVKLDRGFRSAVDCLQQVERWNRAGVELHILDMGGEAINTGAAVGKLFLTMAAAFAEFERGQIRERTTAALAVKRSRGQKTGGGIPFGYRLDGDRLVRDRREYRLIQRMAKLQKHGRSLQAIADTLNKGGIPTKKGGVWSRIQVSRAIANAERYARA